MSLAEPSASLTLEKLGMGSLFQRVSDAILVVESQTNRIALWNPAAEHLFGYSDEDILGRESSRLASPELDALLLNPVGSDSPAEITVISSNGAPLTVEAAVSSVETPIDGSYLVAILRDVTSARSFDRFMREMSVAAAAGENPDLTWFETSTAFLGRSLGVDAVILAEVLGDIVRPVALFQNGEMRPGRDISLSASGLATVAGREFQTVTGVSGDYPESTELLGLAVDTLSGVGLFDRGGRRLGLVAAVSATPLSDPAMVQSVLSLVTARATAEIEKARAEATMRDQTRRLALSTAVTEAISQGGSLADVLQVCAEAMVRHLDVAFARIWIHNEAQGMLDLQASAGLYTHLDGAHGHVPVGQYKIGLIAEERKPHLTNDVANDPRVSDQEWARAEGMVAFAGYPLLVDDRVVGVMAMFSRHPISENTLKELSSVAESIAQFVERRRAETALGRLSRQHELILNAAGEGIYGMDLDGKVTFINPSAAGVLGYQADELIGRRMHDLVHHTRTDGSAYPAAECEALSVLRDAQPRNVEDEVFWTRDGTPIPVHYRTTPVFESGELVGGVVTFSDVTEQRLAQEELARRAQELARSNSELERFAYVASHDLQEPLRAVVSYLQLLERRYGGQLDERADKYITYAVEGSKRMQQLINDLLTYSRAGRMQETLTPISLERVVANAEANLRQAIEDSGAEVVHDPLPEVVADPLLLGQLMQNLIGNAIKFRSADPPRVLVSAQQRRHDWLIRVEDNGIGIDPSFNERIFVIFQRLHGRAEYPGTGIGLAICKKIVERHGGEIWVEPAADHGSVFNFTLPIEQV